MDFESLIDAVRNTVDSEKLKKIFPVIVMVSISDSMVTDEKMQKVQALFGKILNVLKEMEKTTDEGYSTRIAVMIINDSPRWLKEMTFVDCCIKCEIECEKGTANYKDALIELNKKLSRREFMSYRKICQPIIIFITDDEKPLVNCREQIDELNNNGWFRSSNRLAYIVGSKYQDAQDECFCKFVSGTESIFFKEEELEEAIWSLKPKTIGGKHNSMLRNHHDIEVDFGETDIGDLSGDFDLWGSFDEDIFYE